MTTVKSSDFLYISAVIRSREVRMLSNEQAERMLDAPSFDAAAKIAIDCGYPDMSGCSVAELEYAFAQHRSELYAELSANDKVAPIVDLFRLKYDYHNVKALVKAIGAGSDASAILSDSGSISRTVLTERKDLPEHIANAIKEASGALSRTSNPQVSDIIIDRIYFGSMLENAKASKNKFIIDYVKLLIDAANLRIYVRSKRTSRSRDFLSQSLLDGGTVAPSELLELYDSGGVPKIPELAEAAALADDAMNGGSQTRFERACDNAITSYCVPTKMMGFGPELVVAYLTKLDWEIMTLRMILVGKLANIAPSVIRERLRKSYA